MRRGIGEAERVAVGGGVRDRFGAEIAAGAGAVLDHELLAEPLTKLLRHDAGDNVGAAAGRERHDQMDRPLGPRCRLRRGV